uniref:Uncharacterized protein n=1 Tax=Setaria italica TaxID=4555 RepID=K4A3V3_SETIT
MARSSARSAWLGRGGERRPLARADVWGVRTGGKQQATKRQIGRAAAAQANRGRR